MRRLASAVPAWVVRSADIRERWGGVDEINDPYLTSTFYGRRAEPSHRLTAAISPNSGRIEDTGVDSTPRGQRPGMEGRRVIFWTPTD